MGHIQTSYYNFINESKVGKVLYHGSPYRFENFTYKTTFFTDDKDFAIQYSEQKSFEGAMDSDANLYTVNFNGDIFDANNEKELKELAELLPEKIKFSYNNFGFTAEEDKDIFLLNMKGYDIVEPIENINELKIGDKFPNPQYDREEYVVVKKNNKHIYAMLDRILEDELMKKLRSDKNIKEIILPFYKENENKPHNFIPDHLLIAYIEMFLNGSSWLGTPPDNLLEEFNIIKNKIEKELIEERINKGYIKKFVLEPTQIELIDTWRFYENDTVSNAIKKLGYDGYIAKENKKNTYAIFDPKKTIEIIKYEFPVDHKFDSYKDFKSFIKYDQSIANQIKDREDFIKISMYINRFDTYKAYKNNVNSEQYVKNLLDKFNKNNI